MRRRREGWKDEGEEEGGRESGKDGGNEGEVRAIEKVTER